MSWLFRRGKDDDGPKPVRANLGETNQMYYDQEKKRWRIRGQEHLEKEEEELAPPPKAPVPSQGGGEATGGSAPPLDAGGPKKEANQLDALMAPANPYANRFAKSRSAPKAAGQPPAVLGAFGAPPPAAAAAPPEEKAGEAEAESAAAGAPPAFNPSTPKAPEGAPPAFNPFAPKAPGGRGFGGAVTQQVNPNASRAFRGDGDSRAERSERKPAVRPKPVRTSPYAPMSAFPGAPKAAHGECPELDGEGGGEAAAGVQPTGVMDRRRGNLPAQIDISAEEQPEQRPKAGTPPPVPSPYNAQMPSYAPLPGVSLTPGRQSGAAPQMFRSGDDPNSPTTSGTIAQEEDTAKETLTARAFFDKVQKDTSPRSRLSLRSSLPPLGNKPVPEATEEEEAEAAADSEEPAKEEAAQEAAQEAPPPVEKTSSLRTRTSPFPSGGVPAAQPAAAEEPEQGVQAEAAVDWADAEVEVAVEEVAAEETKPAADAEATSGWQDAQAEAVMEELEPPPITTESASGWQNAESLVEEEPPAEALAPGVQPQQTVPPAGEVGQPAGDFAVDEAKPPSVADAVARWEGKAPVEDGRPASAPEAPAPAEGAEAAADVEDAEEVKPPTVAERRALWEPPAEEAKPPAGLEAPASWEEAQGKDTVEAAKAEADAEAEEPDRRGTAAAEPEEVKVPEEGTKPAAESLWEDEEAKAPEEGAKAAAPAESLAEDAEAKATDEGTTAASPWEDEEVKPAAAESPWEDEEVKLPEGGMKAAAAESLWEDAEAKATDEGAKAATESPWEDAEVKVPEEGTKPAAEESPAEEAEVKAPEEGTKPAAVESLSEDAEAKDPEGGTKPAAMESPWEDAEVKAPEEGTKAPAAESSWEDAEAKAPEEGTKEPKDIASGGWGDDLDITEMLQQGDGATGEFSSVGQQVVGAPMEGGAPSAEAANEDPNGESTAGSWVMLAEEQKLAASVASASGDAGGDAAEGLQEPSAAEQSPPSGVPLPELDEDFVAAKEIHQPPQQAEEEAAAREAATFLELKKLKKQNEDLEWRLLEAERAAEARQEELLELRRKGEEERGTFLAKLAAAEAQREAVERRAASIEERLGSIELSDEQLRESQERVAALEAELASLRESKEPAKRSVEQEAALEQAHAKVVALERELSTIKEKGLEYKEQGSQARAPTVEEASQAQPATEQTGSQVKPSVGQAETQAKPATVQAGSQAETPAEQADSSPAAAEPVGSGGAAAATAVAQSAVAYASTVGEGDGHKIKPLMDLLQKHATVARVASQVCRALENLTFTDAENRRTIVELGGVEAILDAIERHRECQPDLVRPCIDALWNVTFDEEAVRRAGGARALDRIAAVMRQHDEDKELQGSAFAVLLNLATEEQNRRKIVQDGLAALVAQAMQRHSESEEVLEQGCQTLYMLAFHQDLKPMVLAAEADAAAAAALAYPRSPGRVQKWGRWLQEVLAC